MFSFSILFLAVSKSSVDRAACDWREKVEPGNLSGVREDEGSAQHEYPPMRGGTH